LPEDGFTVTRALVAVMALDQEPVRALAALPVTAQSHQHKASLELFAD
jgi:hypothetical protein